MSVTAETILARDSEPAFVTLEDNAVLLSVRRGSYFSLNRVGTQIWNMLVEPRRVGDIFDVLARTHDVDASAMTGDVVEFLETLLKRQLVRVVDPDAIV
jgi:hypothetical protein